MHCSGQLAQTCPNCGAALSIKAQFCSRCGTAIPLASSPGTGRLPPATLLATRYRIAQKLGQGGMGAVYLAEDIRLNGKYWAIKEMSDAALTDAMQRQAAVQAFRQEAEMLAKLDHINLPRVSDYFSEGSNQYLAMEYVQGQTLEEKLVQANGPLPESQVTVWAEKLCSVLTYLHSQQPPIIFRDLKPGNIMLRADGEVKLIDFGIARHFKPGQSKDTQAFGTMGYASPEQHGKGQTDVRSDIYALGATLHHLVTGQDPSLNPFTFEPVRRLNPSVSPTFEEAIAKAVDMKPDQRWQNMEQMRQALVKPAAASAAAAKVSPIAQPAALRAVAPTVFTPSPVPAPPALNYANYGKRVGAYLIDSLILAVICLIIYVPTLGIVISSMQSSGAMQSDIDAAATCLALPLLLLAEIFYFIRPTAKSGQTLGKRMVGIRVVDKNGNPPNFAHSLLRYVIGFTIEGLLLYILIGLVGFLWPLWDTQKQAWHDKIAGTFVVEG